MVNIIIPLSIYSLIFALEANCALRVSYPFDMRHKYVPVYNQC